MNSAWRESGERCVVTMKFSVFDPIPLYSGLVGKVLREWADLRHAVTEWRTPSRCAILNICAGPYSVLHADSWGLNAVLEGSSRFCCFPAVNVWKAGSTR